MAAETCGLAEAMDSLWFFPQIPPPEITKTPLPTSESPDYDSSRSSSRSQISVNSSPDDSSSSDGDKRHSRPSRSVLASGKARCHSTSPSSISSARRLRRSESCKSLGDAELEELKGIMDLGFFDFKREKELSEHLVRLIPGLQKIDDRDYRSPLMKTDLRGSEVKSRLKWWARTVALAVQQDS